MPEAREELLTTVLRDLLEAEAAYRSAMNIYKDHPNHHTRISAETRWFWAKNNAKCVLHKSAIVDGQSTPAKK